MIDKHVTCWFPYCDTQQLANDMLSSSLSLTLSLLPSLSPSLSPSTSTPPFLLSLSPPSLSLLLPSPLYSLFHSLCINIELHIHTQTTTSLNTHLDSTSLKATSPTQPV